MLIEAYGSYVCIVKLHCDMIDDFDDTFIAYLNEAKKRFNILLWEDHKYADIGNTMHLQLHGGVHKVSEWADLISCHALVGSSSLRAIAQNSHIMIILITQMSTEGNILDASYTERALQIAKSVDNVIGIVCQDALYNVQPLLTFVPGIRLHNSETSQTSDGCGQQYNSIQNKSFADIFVIGRALTNGIYETTTEYNENETSEQQWVNAKCEKRIMHFTHSETVDIQSQ